MRLEYLHTGKSDSMFRSVMLLISAIVLLIGGGMVYIVFRSLSLPMFGWMNSLGLMGSINELRMICKGITPGGFVLYNLPDLLWITSYLLFVNALIPQSDRTRYLFWLLLMPGLALIHEIMQGLGLAAGSFDVVDMLCYILPTVVNLLIIYISGPDNRPYRN